MKYSDYVERRAFISQQREELFAMSCEEIAAIDIHQRIASCKYENKRIIDNNPTLTDFNEYCIKVNNEELARLEKAIARVPIVHNTDDYLQWLVHEAKYKFRGKRALEMYLYGWSDEHPEGVK